MSTRLSDNLNSNYIGAATKLRAQGARRRIVAYVEFRRYFLLEKRAGTL